MTNLIIHQSAINDILLSVVLMSVILLDGFYLVLAIFPILLYLWSCAKFGQYVKQSTGGH